MNIRLILLLFACVSCTNGKDPRDTAGGGDTSPVGTDDTSTADAQAPEVTHVSLAICGPDPDDLDTWQVAITVTDPQGAADIAAVGATVAVIEGGTTLATYSLVCGSAGTCSGSWQADDDGVDCSVGFASVFRFLVVDQAGNVSAPYDYQPT